VRARTHTHNTRTYVNRSKCVFVRCELCGVKCGPGMHGVVCGWGWGGSAGRQAHVRGGGGASGAPTGRQTDPRTHQHAKHAAPPHAPPANGPQNTCQWTPRTCNAVPTAARGVLAGCGWVLGSVRMHEPPSPVPRRGARWLNVARRPPPCVFVYFTGGSSRGARHNRVCFLCHSARGVSGH
jgi:hypothetical protein